jgi:hypothetical protein
MRNFIFANYQNHAAKAATEITKIAYYGDTPFWITLGLR